MATPEIDVRAGDAIIELLQKDLASEKLELPVLPEVVTRILAEITSNEVNPDVVDNILSEDQVIVSRLMRLVNSALFDHEPALESPSAVISRLGYRVTGTLLVCVSLEDLFHDEDYRVDAFLQLIWRHSCEVAAIAAVIAAQTPGLDRTLGLLAGLSHDIGKVAVVKHTKKHDSIFTTAGAIEFGIVNMHHQVGEVTLGRWQLPVGIIEAALKHDNLNYRHPGPPNYTDVVIAANLQAVCETTHHYSDIDWAGVPAFEMLGVPTDIYFADIESNADIISEIEELLLFEEEEPDSDSDPDPDPDPGPDQDPD